MENNKHSDLERLFDALAEEFTDPEESATQIGAIKRVTCGKTLKAKGYNELHFIYQSFLKEIIDSKDIDISEIIAAFQHCCRSMPLKERKRSEFKKCLLSYLGIDDII